MQAASKDLPANLCARIQCGLGLNLLFKRQGLPNARTCASRRHQVPVFLPLFTIFFFRLQVSVLSLFLARGTCLCGNRDGNNHRECDCVLPVSSELHCLLRLALVELQLHQSEVFLSVCDFVVSSPFSKERMSEIAMFFSSCLLRQKGRKRSHFLLTSNEVSLVISTFIPSARTEQKDS